jgi:hypothetical protein
MTDLVKVELASWIVQDGNYGDFNRGYSAAFALEFRDSTELHEVEPGGTPILSPASAEGARYEAFGQVVHITDEWWAIDVGILIYTFVVEPPRNVQLGSWIGGEICIGIDPFDYFERLAREPDAPALVYDWQIEKIEMQMGLGWREIDKTDAWKDDGGFAEYLLHCRLLDGSPRRTRRRHPERLLPRYNPPQSIG